VSGRLAAARGSMRMGNMRRLAGRRSVAVLVLAALLGSGCGVLGGADPLAGRYVVKGGGGAYDVFLALSQGFAKAHPNVRWDFEDVGSKGGATAVLNGEADIGTASVDLGKSLPTGVEQISIGVSGSALAVAVTNPVTALSRDQARDIYSGKITDWGAVGGTPGPITVVARPVESAIWSTFKAYVFDADTKLKPNVVQVSDTDEALRTLHGSAGTIVLVTANSQSRADQAVRLLAIDGATPTVANLQSGAYKIRRPLFLLYNTTTTLKPAVQAFLSYVRGAEGQAIINNFQ